MMASPSFSLLEVASQRVHAIGARARIGRGADCEIQIDDPMVALTHATLTSHADGTMTIQDLGSRHGTFVGQQRVNQATLRDGDELLIGPISLRLVVAGGAGEADELRRLRAVVELSRVIGVEHDMELLLERVLATLLQLVPADRGAIVIYDPQSRTPRWNVTADRAGGRPPIAISTNVLSQVMVDPRPLLLTELADGGTLDRSLSLAAQDVRSLMVVPLLYRDTSPEWLGVIHLDCQGDGPRFEAADLELMVAVASQAALAIKNALLVAQIQSVRDEQWRRLERVVGDLPVGVVVLDDQHRCLLANPWVTARAALLGEVKPGHTVEQLAGIAPARLTSLASPATVTVGSPPRALTVATAIAGDGSETVIVLTDVTELRQHEERAAHQDRLTLLGQLAGGVAHDFNNLLVVILNNASFLESEPLHATAREDVQQIIHAANRAAELTQRLLTFSRRDPARPQVVEVAQLLRGLERMLGRTLGASIRLVLRMADELPSVRIDPGQLEQVVMNLLINARDAMPDGGVVWLTVSLGTGGNDARHIVIEVADGGTGIAPEVLPRVFEPYFTTKPLGRGTGLGLAMVHGIVQEAGGDITVESTPGRGAVFRVSLPCAVAGASTGPVATAVAAAGSATVLLVDDDEAVRRLSARILQRAGYHVLSALSGPAALELARTHGGDIDLLLSDMVMPGMSGNELAAAMSHVRPALRVLFMSGYDRGATAPHQRLLAKPFTRDGLLDAVAEMLRETSALA